MSNFSFKVVTPEKVTYESQAGQVTLPTTTGYITVLPGHIPLVTVLTPGEVSVVLDDQETLLAVSGGFVEITGNSVAVMADTAERAEEINIEKAEEAKKRAEEALKNAEHQDNIDHTALLAKMEKELSRLRVGRKYRKIRRGN